ncbi:hypothetical protein GFM18_18070 [Rhizobium laguerreae]|nr:hypothetical protein [Rhizobium laguerreae]
MLSSRLVCPWIISITEKGDTKSHYGGCAIYSREEVASASVDLIYRDPHFSSNANYNVLFRST